MVRTLCPVDKPLLVSSRTRSPPFQNLNRICQPQTAMQNKQTMKKPQKDNEEERQMNEWRKQTELAILREETKEGISRIDVAFDRIIISGRDRTGCI